MGTDFIKCMSKDYNKPVYINALDIILVAQTNGVTQIFIRGLPDKCLEVADSADAVYLKILNAFGIATSHEEWEEICRSEPKRNQDNVSD